MKRAEKENKDKYGFEKQFEEERDPSKIELDRKKRNLIIFIVLGVASLFLLAYIIYLIVNIFINANTPAPTSEISVLLNNINLLI